MSAAVLGLLAVASSLRLWSQDFVEELPPQGLLEAPHLKGFNINPLDPRDRDAGTVSNLDKQLTFKGWVDFPPGAGELWIYVGCDGDSFPGNGELRVKVAQPSNTTRIVNNRTVWTLRCGRSPSVHSGPSRRQ